MESYSFEELKTVDEKSLAEINRLVVQLQPEKDPVSFEYFQQILSSNNIFVFVARNNRREIIGMGMVVFYSILIGTKKAWFEDLVVDINYRGQKIGEKILDSLILKAKEEKADVIELTSNPTRIAANSLYQKIGFKLYPTNCYKMHL